MYCSYDKHSGLINMSAYADVFLNIVTHRKGICRGCSTLFSIYLVQVTIYEITIMQTLSHIILWFSRYGLNNSFNIKYNFKT